MTKNPVKVQEDTTQLAMTALMMQKKIRHLPVIDEKKRLIGMVSDRDLRSAYPSTVLSDNDRDEASR